MGMLRIPIIGMVDYGRIVIVFKNNRYSHCNLHFERAATNIMREDNKETLLSHIGVALNVCGSSVTVWTSETVSIIEEL